MTQVGLTDLAGVAEIVEMIWPDSTADEVRSHKSQVAMWATRRATTGFPAALLVLACGPVYSRRQVARWWTRYQTRPAYQRAVRRKAEQ